MSINKTIVDEFEIVSNIQMLQVRIKRLLNRLTGNLKKSKKVSRPITKIERQFYRRQIVRDMIKYADFIEEYNSRFGNIPEKYPYLYFIQDYYLDLSEEIENFNSDEVLIEKILGI